MNVNDCASVVLLMMWSIVTGSLQSGGHHGTQRAQPAVSWYFRSVWLTAPRRDQTFQQEVGRRCVVGSRRVAFVEDQTTSSCTVPRTSPYRDRPSFHQHCGLHHGVSGRASKPVVAPGQRRRRAEVEVPRRGVARRQQPAQTINIRRTAAIQIHYVVVRRPTTAFPANRPRLRGHHIGRVYRAVKYS